MFGRITPHVSGNWIILPEKSFDLDSFEHIGIEPSFFPILVDDNREPTWCIVGTTRSEHVTIQIHEDSEEMIRDLYREVVDYLDYKKYYNGEHLVDPRERMRR